MEAIPAYQKRIEQEPDFNLGRLEQADPTPAKSYVPRLATWWLQGTPLEDLVSRGADALAKYHKLKQANQLKPEHRDVGRFKRFDDFETAMQGYAIAEPESAEDRGRYREIFRDEELIVVELFDETAAQFWGRNTRWCTAARNENMFDHYYERGPLFVITPRQPIRPGERYQYWFNRDSRTLMQFKDEQDRTVNPRNLRFYDKLRGIFSPLSKHLVWNLNPSITVEDTSIKSKTPAKKFSLLLLKIIRLQSDKYQIQVNEFN